MKRLILIIFLLPMLLISEEIEIPDELTPYKNNSEILFSYEFDDKPIFIEQINDREYLVLTMENDEAFLFVYNLDSNLVLEKLEIEIESREFLKDYRINGSYLELYFRNNYRKKKQFLSSGYPVYIRKTTIDISRYKIISSDIIYTTQAKEDYDHEKINKDLKYANENFNEKMLIEEEILNELEIDLADNARINKVYNENDSSKFIIFNLVYDDDLERDYIRFTFFDSNIKSPESKITLLKDSTDELYDKKILFTFLDDNSNLYLLYSWSDYENEKRYITMYKLDTMGEITFDEVEIPYLLFDEEYYINRFRKIKKIEDEIHVLGSARGKYNSIVSLYRAKLNLDSAKLSLDKHKLISVEEGEKLNNDKEIFSFFRFWDIIEFENGLIVLADKSQGVSGFYTYSSFNFFKIDENLNFIWNNYIERDIEYVGNFTVYNRISPEDRFPIQLQQNGSLNKNIYTFTYTTSEPDDYVMRVSYDIKTGKKVDETIFFENDGMPSYMPNTQLQLSKNEYVTILTFNDFYSDNYYLIKYKLNK